MLHGLPRTTPTLQSGVSLLGTVGGLLALVQLIINRPSCAPINQDMDISKKPDRRAT
jgi:hypothetical protein